MIGNALMLYATIAMICKNKDILLKYFFLWGFSFHGFGKPQNSVPNLKEISNTIARWFVKIHKSTNSRIYKSFSLTHENW